MHLLKPGAANATSLQSGVEAYSHLGRPLPKVAEVHCVRKTHCKIFSSVSPRQNIRASIAKLEKKRRADPLSAAATSLPCYGIFAGESVRA